MHLANDVFLQKKITISIMARLLTIFYTLLPLSMSSLFFDMLSLLTTSVVLEKEICYCNHSIQVKWISLQTAYHYKNIK